VYDTPRCGTETRAGYYGTVRARARTGTPAHDTHSTPGQLYTSSAHSMVTAAPPAVIHSIAALLATMSPLASASHATWFWNSGACCPRAIADTSRRLPRVVSQPRSLTLSKRRLEGAMARSTAPCTVAVAFASRRGLWRTCCGQTGQMGAVRGPHNHHPPRRQHSRAAAPRHEG